MGGRLQDKRAFVTGASSGIGRAIAKEYASEGAKVALASRSVDKLAGISETIGKGVYAVECDVRKSESVNGAVQEAVDRMGGLDVVVNNAGVLVRDDIVSTPDDDMEYVIDTNLKGVIRVARETIPELKKTEGTLINISSVSGQSGTPNLGVYVATKGGVDALTRQLAVEYGGENVRVNAIAPGTIKTPMNEEVREKNPDWEEKREEAVPLGRLGTPDDIAGPAVFLASDEAKYITGHVLVVDGGALAL
ncbi:MAG: SDR family oxidoreductase [Halobacteria archaeon]|nr:SDR family oxidoreductase [Halobacteria archaeon]